MKKLVIEIPFLDIPQGEFYGPANVAATDSTQMTREVFERKDDKVFPFTTDRFDSDGKIVRGKERNIPIVDSPLWVFAMPRAAEPTRVVILKRMKTVTGDYFTEMQMPAGTKMFTETE